MPGGAFDPSGYAVVLVDGDDPTLVATAVTTLLADLVGTEDRGLAVEDLRGEEVDLAAVADSCATPPFLAPRRIIVLRDVGAFSTEALAPVLAYLEDPLPTTVLVLVGGGGTPAAKLVAAVKARGHLLSTKVASRDCTTGFAAAPRAPLVSTRRQRALIESHLGEDISRCHHPHRRAGRGARRRSQPGTGGGGALPGRGWLGCPVDLYRRHRRRPDR